MSNRSLIVIFVSCFSLTVAFINWRRGDTLIPSNAARSAQRATAASAGDGNVVSVGPVANLSSAPLVSASSSGDDSPSPPYPDDGPVVIPHDPAQMIVPVAIQTTEEIPGRSARTTVVRNNSSDTLDIMVTALNPPGGNPSTIRVSVPPRRTINLSEAGLVVVSGAQLLVDSPPYLQLTTTAY